MPHSSDSAHEVTGPLFVAYELRLSDAHLPKSDLLTAYAVIGIEEGDPLIKAGYKLVHAVVSSLKACAMILAGNFPSEAASTKVVSETLAGVAEAGRTPRQQSRA